METGRPLFIPVILGTARMGRMSLHAAQLVAGELSKCAGVETDLIDIAKLPLPINDAGEAIKQPDFSAKMSNADALVVVSPEYNHGYSGLLKHVLDSCLKEYIHKARWGGKLFSILGTLLIGVGLGLLAISPGYSMVLVAVFVMGLGAGILDMVLSPIVAALQPDSRAKALNWLHSFYGIGTVITVLGGTLAFRLGMGWRTISLTFVVVPLLVALGFLNVNLPPLISDNEGKRTPMRDLYRSSSFVAVNVAIFLGGALELGLAQWLPAYAEMSLGFSKSTGSISLLAFSAAMALGRIVAGLIGRRVDPIRLMLGCCWTSVALFLLACFAPWPTVALTASVAVGLAGSCLWPTTLGVAADRFPRGGATMFGLLAAFGNLGGILMPWLVGVTSDRSSLRLGLATSTACPLLMAFVLLWLQRQPLADFRQDIPVVQAA